MPRLHPLLYCTAGQPSALASAFQCMHYIPALFCTELPALNYSVVKITEKVGCYIYCSLCAVKLVGQILAIAVVLPYTCVARALIIRCVQNLHACTAEGLALQCSSLHIRSGSIDVQCTRYQEYSYKVNYFEYFSRSNQLGIFFVHAFMRMPNYIMYRQSMSKVISSM